MISEKRAELNLTTELLNWFFGVTRRVHDGIFQRGEKKEVLINV
jgi:hypothetical protein